MARKQVGMIDGDLLAKVDERASELGQTRRVFVERALERVLADGDSVDGALRAARVILADPERFSSAVVETAQAAVADEKYVARGSRREHLPSCKCPVCS